MLQNLDQEGRGGEGRKPQRKGAGGIQEAEEERAVSRISMVAGAREIEKNYTIFCNTFAIRI